MKTALIGFLFFKVNCNKTKDNKETFSLNDLKITDLKSIYSV